MDKFIDAMSTGVSLISVIISIVLSFFMIVLILMFSLYKFPYASNFVHGLLTLIGSAVVGIFMMFKYSKKNNLYISLSVGVVGFFSIIIVGARKLIYFLI